MQKIGYQVEKLFGGKYCMILNYYPLLLRETNEKMM